MFSCRLFLTCVYSIPVVFIYIWFNTWNSFWVSPNFSIIYCNLCHILKTFIIFFSLSSYFSSVWIYCYFLVFDSVERLYKWSNTFKIYFAVFVIQLSKRIKRKIAPLNHFSILKEVIQTFLQWLYLRYHKPLLLCYHSWNALPALHRYL